MLKQNEVEEIKKLIKHGFDLELISFELDIPIEDVEKCKAELNKVKHTKVQSAKEVIDKRNKLVDTKINQIKERYKKLFFKNAKVQVREQKYSKSKGVEKVNLIISEVEKLLKEIIECKERISKILPNKKLINDRIAEGIEEKTIREEVIKNLKELGRLSSKLLSQLNEIEKYKLTIEQAEKLYSLIHSEHFDKPNLKWIGEPDYYMPQNRAIIDAKLVETIDIMQSETEDTEELKNLSKKLEMKLRKSDKVKAETIKRKIENKINKIDQQKVVDRVKNDIPESIKTIIQDLAGGTLDIQVANEIIENEVKNRATKNPKTKFALTDEQLKKQILYQIKTNLEEKPEQYNIDDPEKTIMQIEELCGGELEQAIRVVVKNLIEKKDFEKAKQVFEKTSSRLKNNSSMKYKKILKKEIQNAEIADMILKLINMDNIEEQRMYFNLIENGIEKENINLSAISLGKSQDGSKSITLEDIWTDERQNGSYR